MKTTASLTKPTNLLFAAEYRQIRGADFNPRGYQDGNIPPVVMHRFIYDIPGTGACHWTFTRVEN